MDTSQLRRPSNEYRNNEGFNTFRRSSSPGQERSRNSSRASSINYPIPDIKVHGPNDEADYGDFRKSSTSLEIDFQEEFHSYEDKSNASSFHSQSKQDEDDERPISPSIMSLPDLETYMAISSSVTSATSLPNSLPESIVSKVKSQNTENHNSQTKANQERRTSLLNSNNVPERSRRKSVTDLAPFMQPRKSIVELTPAMQARISIFESSVESQADTITGDINMGRRKSVMDEIPNLERRRSIRNEVLELEQRYMSRNESPSPDASDDTHLKRRRSVRHEILSYERRRSSQDQESNKRRKSRDEDENSNSSVSNTSSDFDHDIVMRAEISEPTSKKSIKKRVLDMVRRKSATDNKTEDMKENEIEIQKQLLDAEEQKKDATYLRYRKSITELEPYFQYQNEARRLSTSVLDQIAINEYANKDSDMYKEYVEGIQSESEDSQPERKDLMTENKVSKRQKHVSTSEETRLFDPLSDDAKENLISNTLKDIIHLKRQSLAGENIFPSDDYNIDEKSNNSNWETDLNTIKQMNTNELQSYSHFQDDHDQDIKDGTHSDRRKSVALEVLEFIGRRLSIPSLTDDEKAFSDTPKSHLPHDDNHEILNSHSKRHSSLSEDQKASQNSEESVLHISLNSGNSNAQNDESIQITLKENEADNGQRKQSLTKDVLGFLSRRLSNAMGTDNDNFMDKTLESFTSDDPESIEHKYIEDTGKIRRKSSSKENKRESLGTREGEQITLKDIAKSEIITSPAEPVSLEVAHNATKRSPRGSVSSVNTENSTNPISQDNDYLDTEIIQYDQRRKSVSMDALDFMVRKFSSEPIPDHQSKNITSTYKETFESENGTSSSEDYKKESDLQNENDGELHEETRRQSLGREVLGFIARRLSNSLDPENVITPLVSGEPSADTKRKSISDNYQDNKRTSSVDDSHTFIRKLSSSETSGDGPEGQFVSQENAEDDLKNESEIYENITLHTNEQDTRRKSLGMGILEFINRRLSSNSFENENISMPHELSESQISPESRRYSKSSTSSNRKLSAGSSENIQRVRSPSVSNEERHGSRRESATRSGSSSRKQSTENIQRVRSPSVSNEERHGSRRESATRSGSSSRKQSRLSEDYIQDHLLPETNNKSQIPSVLSEQYQQSRRKSSTKSPRVSLTDGDISRSARNRRHSQESYSTDDDSGRSNRNSLLLEDKNMTQYNQLSYDEDHNIRRSSVNTEGQLVSQENAEDSLENESKIYDNITSHTNDQDTRRKSLGIEILEFINRRLSNSYENENASMPHETDESQISAESRRYSKSSTSSNRKLSTGTSENIQRVRSPSVSNEERHDSRRESLSARSGSSSRKQSRLSEDYSQDLLLPETNIAYQITSVLSEQQQQPRRKSSTKSPRDSVTDVDISRSARNRRQSHRESNSTDGRSNRNSLLLEYENLTQYNPSSYDEDYNIRSAVNTDEKRSRSISSEEGKISRSETALTDYKQKSPRVSVSEINNKLTNESTMGEDEQRSEEGSWANEEDTNKTDNEIRRNSLGIEVLKFIARRLSNSQEEENSSTIPAIAVENVKSNDELLPPNTQEISADYISRESPEENTAYEEETEHSSGLDKEGNRRKSIGMEVFDFITRRLSNSMENEDSTKSLTTTEGNIESDTMLPENAEENNRKISRSEESPSEEHLGKADENIEINKDVQATRRKSLGMEVLQFVARRLSNSVENEHIDSPSVMNDDIIKSTDELIPQMTEDNPIQNSASSEATEQTLENAQDARNNSLGTEVLEFIARRLSTSSENENYRTLTENIKENIQSADELVPQNTPEVSKRISLPRETPSDEEIAHNYENDNTASNKDGHEARRKSLGMEILEFVGRRLSNTFENENSSIPHTTDEDNVKMLDESQISQDGRRYSKSSNSSTRKLSTGSPLHDDRIRSRKTSTSNENGEYNRRDSQSSAKSHRSLSQNRSDRSHSPSLSIEETQSSRKGSTLSRDFLETMSQAILQEGILRFERGSASNEEMPSLSVNDASNSQKASEASGDYMRDLLLLKADITSDIRSKQSEQYQRSHRKSLSRSSRDSLTEKETQRSRRESLSPEHEPRSRRASSKSNQLSNEEHNFQNTLGVPNDGKRSRRGSTSSKEGVIYRKESTSSEYGETPRRVSKSESGQTSNRESLSTEDGHKIRRQSSSSEKGRISQRNSILNEDENNQTIVNEMGKSPKRDSLSVDNSQKSRRGSRSSEKDQKSNRESMSFEDDNKSRRSSTAYGEQRSRRSSATYGEQRSRRSSASNGEQRSRRSSASNGEQRSRRSSAVYEEQRSRRQSLQAGQKSQDENFETTEESETEESRKSNRESVSYDDSYSSLQDSMHSDTKQMYRTDFLSVENYGRSPRGSITDDDVRLTRRRSTHSNRDARSHRGSISSEDMNHGSVSIDELNNYRKNSVYAGWYESDNRYVVPESDTESSDMTYDKYTESDEVLKQCSKVELISFIKKSMLEEESEITDFGTDSDSGSELNFELPINDFDSDNQSLDTIVNNFTSQYKKHEQEQTVIVNEESTKENEFTTDLYEGLYGHIMTILTLPELGGEPHEVTATFVPDVTLDSECDEKSKRNKYIAEFRSKGIIKMSSVTQLDTHWTTLEQQLEKGRKPPNSISAVTFCGCGFLGVYLVGAATYLQEHAPYLLKGKIAGSSVGSLIAACIVCGVPIEKVRRNILTTADIAQRYLLGPFNPFFPIEEPLLKNLLRIIPEDGHIKASGRLFLSLTRATTLTNEIVSEYSSRDELVRAILCCCFLPVISGFSVPSYNGRKYIDGGMSNNMPLKGPNTLAINAFAGDFDICPEDPDGDERPFASAFNQSIKMTNNNLTRLVHSLLPPPPELLDKHFENGYNDAKSYLHPQIQNRASTL